MKNLLLMATALALMAIESVLGHGQMSSTDYHITTTAISGGGVPMASANYRLNGTLGQTTPLMEQGMVPYSDNYELFPGFWYTIGPFSDTCPGDFDWDFDVDGADLQEYIYDSGGLGLRVFAASFGKDHCP
jgi:hypothetical protein